MADVNSIVFDAMLKEAVTANFRKRMNAMPSEEELLRKHPPSAEHIYKMNLLFTRERRRIAAKKLLAFTKVAVFFLCIVSTVLFSILMFNPHVRAAVRDAIVEFFDGFNRIEFIESDEDVSRSAESFTPGYVPDGYELISVEEYGDSSFTVYADGGGRMLMLNVALADTHMGNLDDREYRAEIHDGVTYHVYETSTSDDYSDIAWIQSGFMFFLSGEISIEGLMEVALSIK